MAHIVCEPCRNCKYTDCVAVCPVECFHEDELMLYIDPDECIDCALCIPECPVEAIFADSDVPEQWQSYIQENAEKAPKLPVINEQKDPLPTAPPRAHD
jgi:ferredoxin